jgi:hypothetical protein
MPLPLKTSDRIGETDFARSVNQVVSSRGDQAITFEDFDHGDRHARALQRQLAERFFAQGVADGGPDLGLRARATIIVGSAAALWLAIGGGLAAILG